jgi:hypothetical protein
MAEELTGPELTSWAPESCTLPTAERPLRAAEFDSLLSTAASVRRLAPTRLRITLAGGPDVAATARDLTARETACCSFFTFAVDELPSGVVLEISVPPPHVAVLDGLARRTAAAARPAPPAQ